MSTQAKVAVITGGSRGIGKASAIELARRGYDVHSLGWKGMHDEQMLKIVGPKERLLISCNVRMLLPGVERELFIMQKMGAVFLASGQEHLERQLALWLRKWKWLEQVDATPRGPFAWFVSPDGKISQTHRVKGIELAIL